MMPLANGNLDDRMPSKTSASPPKRKASDASVSLELPQLKFPTIVANSLGMRARRGAKVETQKDKQDGGAQEAVVAAVRPRTLECQFDKQAENKRMVSMHAQASENSAIVEIDLSDL